MNPKEKAKELVCKFQEDADNKCDCEMTFCECPFGMSTAMAVKCAKIEVDEILKTLDAFGYSYTGTLYDCFYTGNVVNIEEKDPCKYWNEVKDELNKL